MKKSDSLLDRAARRSNWVAPLMALMMGAGSALAGNTVVFQADINGNSGTPNVGPVHAGWTAFTGSESGNPATWTHTQTINGITIALTLNSTAAGNTGYRNRSLPTAGPLSDMYQALVFAANSFDLKLTGLTPGVQYQLILYNWDSGGGNTGDRHWNYSLAGNRTNPVDAGWVWQPTSSVFTPTANTGVSQAAKGTAMLSTIFAPTGDSVNFFTVSGGVHALNGFELYQVTAPLSADAGPDKSVTPSSPSTTIGAAAAALGGTGPYTYSWSPAEGLSDASSPNPTATLSGVGAVTYTLTVTDSTLATATDTVTVTWPVLGANAGADKTLTPAAPSAQLGGSPSATGGTPYYVYSWSPATGLSDPAIANPTASPAVTTTYTLTVTDSLGVIATDEVTVNYPLAANAGTDKDLSPLTPSAEIGGSPTACGGTGPFTYLWTPATGLSSDSVANPTASPTTTTTYTVTVTDTATSQSVQDTVTVSYTIPNDNLVSVDFVVGSGTGTGPCSGDTTAAGTMKNSAGNQFSGQAGTWNHLSIGTYNQSSATTGLLKNGGGSTTTVKLALGLATGEVQPAAGGWRCSPNEGAANSIKQLRNEMAYLYPGVLTGDHYAWAITGLTPNTTYKLTLFGSGTVSSTTNVAFPGTAAEAAATKDSEGDWDWAAINSDENGAIRGTLTGTTNTPGIQGMQIEGVMPLLTPLVASAGPNQSVSEASPSVVIGGSPTASGGAGSYTYSWSPATGLSSTTAANPTATPVETTTYTVTVSDGVSTPAVASVTVTVTVGSTYDTWAAVHAGGQTASEDFDADGVANGVEFFIGAPDGMTTLPGVVNGKVTWPHVGSVSSFAVQVSDDLTTWTAADPVDVDTSVAGEVTYTLPAGSTKKFCRLMVTP